jgi:hypothetical protein
MRNRIYRHSVWFNVFSVVLAGAVVLGGAGYLLYHVGDAATGLTGSGAERGVEAASPRHAPSSVRHGPSAARSSRSLRGSGGSAARGSGTGPLLSDRSESGGWGVPFSESWRSGATPDLGARSGQTGPPASPGGASGARSEGVGSREAGPRDAGSSPTASRSGSVSGTSGFEGAVADRGGGAGWRAEAGRLGGRARALSGELRRLNQQSAETEREASSDDPATATAPGGSAETSDRDVPNPPDPVPIGDHLYWLAVAGVLWGAWRIGRGG